MSSSHVLQRSEIPSLPLAPTAARYAAKLHEALDTIAPAWRGLEASGRLLAYQRLDWVEPIVAHVAGPAKARPLFVEVSDRATGRPVMILPLALLRRPMHSAITWMNLGVCDYAAPILAEAEPLTPDGARAAWDAVLAVLPKADLIDIVQVPETVDGVANPLMALAACRPMAFTASGIAMDGEPGTLLKRLCRSSTLRDLGKQRRRLERAGTVAFVCARTPGEVDAIFAALVEQRRRRFAAIGRFDLLARPEIAAFYRATALQGLENGPVRLFGLSVDGEWVATFCGLLHGTTFHGLIVTMSDAEAWRNTSPGLQIYGDCLCWARSQGVTYFDFSVGDLPYKRDFGAEIRPLSELLQPLTARGRLVARAGRAADAGQAWLKRHPALFERLRKARRRLRRAGAA